MVLENLTKEELEQKVLNGEYIKEELSTSETPGIGMPINKSLTRFNYFNIQYTVDTSETKIQSVGYVQVMKLTDANISNKSMKITYNGVQKDIIIGADEGDFSNSASIPKATEAIEALLANKIQEAFGDDIEFSMMTMGSGRLFKITLRVPDTVAEGEIIVNSGDSNDLLPYLKLSNGQKCIKKELSEEEKIFTRNNADAFPINTELCDTIGYERVYSNNDIWLEMETIEDRAGGAEVKIVHVDGYRPKRRKIYIYQPDSNIYLYSNDNFLLHDKDTNVLISK